MQAVTVAVVVLYCFHTTDAFEIQRSLFSATENVTVKYEVEERGSLYTADYAIYFKGPQGYISPWHDIPLYANEAKKVFNMVVEIPRWSNAKMEMTTRASLNPIKQDQQAGVVRFVHNIFPNHGYIWNYGALPQTWENNSHIDADSGTKGDNDPIDIIEIGQTIHKTGAVIQVKVVGCLALIDSGETDWKLVAIDVADPMAKHINTMKDVEKLYPGYAEATVDWFKQYKMPAGKPANTFGYNGKYKDAAFCHKVIEETNVFWRNLMAEPNPHLNTLSTVEGSVHFANQSSAAATVAAAPAPSPPAALPANLDKWLFIKDD